MINRVEEIEQLADTFPEARVAIEVGTHSEVRFRDIRTKLGMEMLRTKSPAWLCARSSYT